MKHQNNKMAAKIDIETLYTYFLHKSQEYYKWTKNVYDSYGKGLSSKGMILIVLSDYEKLYYMKYENILEFNSPELINTIKNYKVSSQYVIYFHDDTNEEAKDFYCVLEKNNFFTKINKLIPKDDLQSKRLVVCKN